MRSVFRSWRSNLSPLAVVALCLGLGLVSLQARVGIPSSVVKALHYAQAPPPATNITINAALASGTRLSCASATVRCVPSEYGSIAACASAANAGDICLITGDRVETPTFTHNGASGNTITFLGNGPVKLCGLSFSNNSYLRFIGLTFDGNASGCSNSSTLINSSGTNTGLEFWNVTVTNTTANAELFDFYGNSARCDKCIWLGGSFSNIGVTQSATALGPNGNDVFVGYIRFTNICYIGVGPSGVRGRFLNLNFDAMVQCGPSHPDFYYIHGLSTLGFSSNLIESTFGIGTPTADQNKFHHQQNQTAVAWADTVYRLSVGTNIGSGAYSIYATGTGDVLRTHWYNNTWVLNIRATNGTTACGSGRADGTTTVTISFFNELYYECWSADVSTNVQGTWGYQASAGTLTVTQDCNLGFDPDGSVMFHTQWTSQARPQSNVDPKFNNVGSRDFTLQTTSGAQSTGCALTTAVGSGSNSTTLTVATGTGGSFIGDNSGNLPQYGGALVPGDDITVGTTTVRVSSVSGDVLTLATPITWVNGAPVYFGTSSTVPIGAYPFKAGGFTITATAAKVGSTVTVTPSDASLVRFVIVYENNIPVCVDNSSPYTCTVGPGVIITRTYPKYASQTQWATAIPN